MKVVFLLLIWPVAWAAAPQRIISTAPSVTETLFAIGAGPHVVAVTIYCRYPPEVLKLPKIGTYLTADVETISALHPDLVVVEKQPNNLVEHLRLLGIPEIEVQSANLDQVYQGAIDMGKATGRAEAAAAFVKSMRVDLANMRAQTSTRPRPTAVFLVGRTPGTLQGLIAGAKGSYFSDLLSIAGAKDAFADSVAPYPQITMEEVLARDPDLIIEMSGDSRTAQSEIHTLWQAHPSLRAVKHQHIYAVPADSFQVPGPRIIQAAHILLHLVHPEMEP